MKESSKPEGLLRDCWNLRTSKNPPVTGVDTGSSSSPLSIGLRRQEVVAYSAHSLNTLTSLALI